MSKRLCIAEGRNATGKCDNGRNDTNLLAITECLPAEIIELILIKTVVAQTLDMITTNPDHNMGNMIQQGLFMKVATFLSRPLKAFVSTTFNCLGNLFSRSKATLIVKNNADYASLELHTPPIRPFNQTCELNPCLNDSNLVAVCRRWQLIVEAVHFREIAIERVTKIDPRAVYKHRADAVKVSGIKFDNDADNDRESICLLGDNLYTVEKTSIHYIIFVYDTIYEHRHFGSNVICSHRLVCSNRREFPHVYGDWSPDVILGSAKDNCLFILGGSIDSTVFKVTPDGTVLTEWNVPDGGTTNLAIDPLGNYLVYTNKKCAMLYTSVGTHVATILLGDNIDVHDVSIMRDATVVIYHSGMYGMYWASKWEYKLTKLQPLPTSDGSLIYRSMHEAANFPGQTYTIKVPNRHSMSKMFVDRNGYVIIACQEELLIVNEEMNNVVTATGRMPSADRYRYSCVRFDEERGLIFAVGKSENDDYDDDGCRPTTLIVSSVKHAAGGIPHVEH